MKHFGKNVVVPAQYTFNQVEKMFGSGKRKNKAHEEGKNCTV